MPLFRTRTGQLFLACNTRCAEAFNMDRQFGLIYGPYQKPGGGFYLNAEEASIGNGCCVYCNTDLTTPPNINQKETRPC